MVIKLKNKRAYLRIVEAFIAVMLIAGVMTFVFFKQHPQIDQTEKIRETEKIILQKVASEEALRTAVLNGDNQTLNLTIAQYIPPEYIFLFRICDINEICKLERASNYYTDKEIVSEETPISSTLQQYNLKKIKIFVWEK